MNPPNRTSQVVDDFLRIGKEEGLSETLDKILRKYKRMEKELQAIRNGGDPWSRSVAAESLAFDPLTP